MRADPEPVDPARDRQPERSVVKANPDAVILPVPHRLEMQRRMRRIGFELIVHYVMASTTGSERSTFEFTGAARRHRAVPGGMVGWTSTALTPQ